MEIMEFGKHPGGVLLLDDQRISLALDHDVAGRFPGCHIDQCILRPWLGHNDNGLLSDGNMDNGTVLETFDDIQRFRLIHAHFIILMDSSSAKREKIMAPRTAPAAGRSMMKSIIRRGMDITAFANSPRFYSAATATCTKRLAPLAIALGRQPNRHGTDDDFWPCLVRGITPASLRRFLQDFPVAIGMAVPQLWDG
ncbi:hypothetical protein ACFQOZ_20175 [Comamonas endophytica]|uniref:hypothetical protein n=1 Tax=Comamonas endophytica TaxID=2949090 RepID=UPI0036129423